MPHIKKYIKNEDTLLLPEEEKNLEYDIIDMIFPLLLRLQEKGYVESLKDSSGAFDKHIILIGNILFSTIEAIKSHKELKQDFDPFLDDTALSFLKGYAECKSDEEKKAFQKKLHLELSF
ncbi:hypothetical protein HON22_01990 [Candidatus Peregrinibacteria bacterium]|nr:hypothetical protein [Candidatus Peregrinibacteria bacterium]